MMMMPLFRAMSLHPNLHYQGHTPHLYTHTHTPARRAWGWTGTTPATNPWPAARASRTTAGGAPASGPSPSTSALYIGGMGRLGLGVCVFWGDRALMKHIDTHQFTRAYPHPHPPTEEAPTLARGGRRHLAALQEDGLVPLQSQLVKDAGPDDAATDAACVLGWGGGGGALVCARVCASERERGVAFVVDCRRLT